MATQAEEVADLKAVQDALTTLLVDDAKLITDVTALLAKVGTGVLVPQADIDAIDAAAKDQLTKITAAISAIEQTDTSVVGATGGSTGTGGP